MEHYTKLNGFEDLREYKMPRRKFRSFARIQKFLASWEEARKRGQKVPPYVREVAAQYQQCLFQYPNSKLCAEEYGEGPDVQDDPQQCGQCEGKE